MNIPKTMRAIITPEYGPPEILQIEEVPVPTITENEILIRVHATSISIGDIRIRGAIFPAGFGLLGKLMIGINKPNKEIQGVDFAGEVVAIGSNVTRFTVGDKVFGIDSNEMGSYADYKKAKENAAIAKIPENMNYQEAVSLVFGGSTALGYLYHKTKISKGDKILINGASGAVGSISVQLAKYFGAEVTAVTSGKNVALVASLGADNVIDYTVQNVTEINRKFDIVMDAVGNITFDDAKKLLTKSGRFLPLVGGVDLLVAGIFNKQIIAGEAGERAEDMELLKKLAESGHIKPVIDRTYQFGDIVAAHTYVEKGHKVGSVILKVAEN